MAAAPAFDLNHAQNAGSPETRLDPLFKLRLVPTIAESGSGSMVAFSLRSVPEP
jgi:hypothetical protein